MIRAVDSIKELIPTLTSKGVIFEHYIPGLWRKGDLHIKNKMKIAWFKEPAEDNLNLYKRCQKLPGDTAGLAEFFVTP